MQELEWRSVDPSAPQYWWISSALGTAWIPLPLGWLAVHLSDEPALGWCVPLLVLAWLLALRRLARWRYRRVRYALADDGLLIRSGIWWQQELYVPRVRIQHVDVSEGPLARRYGLATLVLHTAGAHLHAADLSGLAAAEAYALRDALLRREAGTGGS